MPLQLDFVRDVAARCVERLAEAGYALSPANDEEAIYTYVKVRYRRVRPQPRTVHKAAYTAPAHRAEGERQFLEKVERGEDLWPHQSREIDNPAFEDGMLNDFGVQHFHLGTGPDRRRPHLIQGHKEVLFAIVRERDFYAIGIYDHSSWTKQAVLDVVHETWPDLTKPFTIKGTQGPTRVHSDAEVKALRDKSTNYLQQRPDGTIQMGIGGGIMANGGSLTVRRETDRLIVHVEGLQEEVQTALEEQAAAGRIAPDAQVRLIWDDEKPYLVTEPPSVKADMSSALIIPAL